MIAADLTVKIDRNTVVDFSITLYKARRTLIALSNKNRKEIKFSINEAHHKPKLAKMIFLGWTCPLQPMQQHRKILFAHLCRC